MTALNELRVLGWLPFYPSSHFQIERPRRYVLHDSPLSRQACMAAESLIRQHDALFSMLGTTLGRRGSRLDPQNERVRPTAQVSGFSTFMNLCLQLFVN